MTDLQVQELELRSAYMLRTYVVGSVMPMWRNKVMSAKIQAGLSSLLSEAGPDVKSLAALTCDGLALRAVSWKTSSSLLTHTSIMQLAGEDRSMNGIALVSTCDPSLSCLRSKAFLRLARQVMADEIQPIERDVVFAAVLSLVSKTPSHPSVSQGLHEGMLDVIAETRHLDGSSFMTIPETDKSVLRDYIDPIEASKSHKSGWADAYEVERAIKLIDTSILWLTGTRHSTAEKDHLLIDFATGDVSCTHDAAHQYAIVRGETPSGLDVPLEMFTLHVSIVMAAAIRIIAKHTHKDRDTMMEELAHEPPLFDQVSYLSKSDPKPPKVTKAKKSPQPKSLKAARVAAEEEDSRESMTVRDEMKQLFTDLENYKARCEARFAILEKS